jgi:hypothetical protein
MLGLVWIPIDLYVWMKITRVKEKDDGNIQVWSLNFTLCTFWFPKILPVHPASIVSMLHMLLIKNRRT